jgi:hypothetical protein
MLSEVAEVSSYKPALSWLQEIVLRGEIQL